MRRFPTALTGTIAALLVTAGCGGSQQGGAAPPPARPAQATSTPTMPGSPTPVPNAPVRVSDTKIGEILVDGQGRTVYLFEKDKEGKPTCYDECAEEWPPYLTEGKPKAEDGAKADLLSTTARKDGAEQVTYGKWPLYYYHDDKKPGDTTGHDKKEFGAEWYALNAAGKKAGE
ncbi:hypothetical protein [Nonomuraea lactucae]|uniref:COG4315 family predicted lipoprotein n=1 Tax=Nonomuraea lactucae TaxID=2249762 RepID=UPI001965B895|nr:hypothetical protein [Nonomuraea lactucae]